MIGGYGSHHFSRLEQRVTRVDLTEVKGGVFGWLRVGNKEYEVLGIFLGLQIYKVFNGESNVTVQSITA